MSHGNTIEKFARMFNHPVEEVLEHLRDVGITGKRAQDVLECEEATYTIQYLRKTNKTRYILEELARMFDFPVKETWEKLKELGTAGNKSSLMDNFTDIARMYKLPLIEVAANLPGIMIRSDQVDTVEAFARMSNRPIESMLELLQEAGITSKQPQDELTNEDLTRLCKYIWERGKNLIVDRQESGAYRQHVHVATRKKRTFAKKSEKPAVAKEETKPTPASSEVVDEPMRKKGADSTDFGDAETAASHQDKAHGADPTRRTLWKRFREWRSKRSRAASHRNPVNESAKHSAPTESVSSENLAESVTERLQKLLDQLEGGLIERDIPLRLAILAALSGEHILLVGPPGTAKSQLARRIKLAFPETEGAYFERLLTKFTVPEELFGPLSIKGLEEDRYERLTEKYLPQASIAFLDEIFKANSAILNALLTLLNERKFDNGTERVDAPLIAVIGASNELPEGEELNALFDRFLFRYYVSPVTSDSFPKLLRLSEGEPKPDSDLQFTMKELEKIRESVEVEVQLSDDVENLLKQMREWCQSENINVSDRRWRKIVTMLKVSAFTDDRDEVSVWDAWLTQHCIWENPEQKEKVSKWYEDRVGVGQKDDHKELIRVINVLEKNLEEIGKTRDGEQKKIYIENKIAETAKILQDVHQYQDFLLRQRRNLDDQIRDHLWVPDSFADAAAGALHRALGGAEELVKRAENLQEGFKSLRLEDKISDEDVHEDNDLRGTGVRVRKRGVI